MKKQLIVVGIVILVVLSVVLLSNRKEVWLFFDKLNYNLSYDEAKVCEYVSAKEEYVEKEMLYPVFLYVNEAVKDADKLSDDELLFAADAYKKLIKSIDYIDSMSRNETDLLPIFVVDDLPDMQGLHSDLKEKLVKTLYERNTFLLPSCVSKELSMQIVEQYLVYTENIPLKDVMIVELGIEGASHIKDFCVLSREGKFLFELGCSLNYEPNTDYPLRFTFDYNHTFLSDYNVNVPELKEYAVSITDAEGEIPIYTIK